MLLIADFGTSETSKGPFPKTFASGGRSPYINASMAFMVSSFLFIGIPHLLHNVAWRHVQYMIDDDDDDDSFPFSACTFSRSFIVACGVTVAWSSSPDDDSSLLLSVRSGVGVFVGDDIVYEYIV